MKALVDLLREKGVVTGEEAAGFIQKLAGAPSPEETKGYGRAGAGRQGPGSQQAGAPGRRQASSSGSCGSCGSRRGTGRSILTSSSADIKDVEEIIDRMRVIGVITPAYADEAG